MIVLPAVGFPAASPSEVRLSDLDPSIQLRRSASLPPAAAIQIRARTTPSQFRHCPSPSRRMTDHPWGRGTPRGRSGGG